MQNRSRSAVVSRYAARVCSAYSRALRRGTRHRLVWPLQLSSLAAPGCPACALGWTYRHETAHFWPPNHNFLPTSSFERGRVRRSRFPAKKSLRSNCAPARGLFFDRIYYLDNRSIKYTRRDADTYFFLFFCSVLTYLEWPLANRSCVAFTRLIFWRRDSIRIKSENRLYCSDPDNDASERSFKSTKKGCCSGKLCLFLLLTFVCVSFGLTIKFLLLIFLLSLYSSLCISFSFICNKFLHYLFSFVFLFSFFLLCHSCSFRLCCLLSLMSLAFLCYVSFLVFVNLFCLFCPSVSRSLRFVGLFWFVLFPSITSLLFRSLSVSFVFWSLLSLLSFLSVCHVLFVYAVSSFCCSCLSVSSVSLSRSLLGLFRSLLSLAVYAVSSVSLSLCLFCSSIASWR